jgi:hypothetical protein
MIEDAWRSVFFKLEMQVVTVKGKCLLCIAGNRREEESIS